MHARCLEASGCGGGIGSWDAERHRRRLRSLADVNRAVGTCAREHAIGEYLAGQVTYNLGEYPAPLSLAPTEYDAHLLEELASHGVQLIQVHEEWNDSLRRMGADKFTTHDPEGLTAFIDLVHSLGMKMMLYTTTGFFPVADPDFRPEWAQPGRNLREMYWHYARCSPASPGWRAYVLPRIERIMEEYGIDGIYNDTGYQPLYLDQPVDPTHVSPGLETAEHDAALEDMLGLTMDLVHKRGGVMKVHIGKCSAPACGTKVYDYLWVGEAVRSADVLREKTCRLEPYVVPALDMSRNVLAKEDDLYLHSAPFMQFPLRVDGRPVTGERAAVEDIEYTPEETCFWTRHLRAVRRERERHPDAPPTYGWWDSCPGRAAGRSRWLHHYDLYRPMVRAGTHAWIDVRETTLFEPDRSGDVTMSLFVNDEIFLVAANYGEKPEQLPSAWSWEDRERGSVGKGLTVPPRTICYFRRTRGQRRQ